MDINVKTIKFDATDKLQEFIQKKVGKLDKLCNDIRKVEVSLKVVKPETAMNKQASLTVVLPKTELFAEKICDTFEEAPKFAPVSHGFVCANGFISLFSSVGQST